MAAIEANMAQEGAGQPSEVKKAEPSLSTLSRECDAAIDKIHTVVRASKYSREADELENASGRYRVWANNLGAFQRAESQASLDHRLRDSVEMRSNIRQELVDIVSISGRGGCLLHVATVLRTD